MKLNEDIVANFPGLLIIHQKIRGHVVQSHRHSAHELFLPLQGEIQIKAQGRILKAGSGKMLYLPPHVEHTFQASSTGEGERLILLIDQNVWTANLGGIFKPSVVNVGQLGKEIIFHLLLNPKTKAAIPLIQTLLQTTSEALETQPSCEIGNLAHLSGRAQDERIRKALTFIEAHFSEAITAEDLAKASAMSVRTQNRLFLTELGMTPKQVISLFRIEMAKKLLLKKDKSVTDVAFEVGYQSASQFSTVFRGLTGRLPSELLR